MIGVVAAADEMRAVEEFFELFKTPWEPWQKGRAYDAIIVSKTDIPDNDAGLVIVYGAEQRPSDRESGIIMGLRREGARLCHQGSSIPIYGAVRVIKEGHGRIASRTVENEVAAIEIEIGGRRCVRAGFELFTETAWLLDRGQPIENASIPTLDWHIEMLRNWLLEAGLTVLEIPPAPAGCDFIVCLTHDVDFVGIRRHKFDHTMWGFVWRASWVAALDFLRGRISARRLADCWQAVAALPFVFLGLARDFWVQFDWYLRVEKNLPATYFLIPFKNRPGDRLNAAHGSRRATKYDVADIPEWVEVLHGAGCEIGVHGIDAWHSVEQGKLELERVRQATGLQSLGVRMHWLLRDDSTCATLERAGFTYDSTAGYNEAVGYRNGTSQVFCPLNVDRIVELPLHIQDGALFFRNRMGLSQTDAWDVCHASIAHAEEHGGVLTILWHDRSPGPERFWGDFYVRLLESLKARKVWFATAGQAVEWFKQRRKVKFVRTAKPGCGATLRLVYDGQPMPQALTVRIRLGGAEGKLQETNISWTGATEIDVGSRLAGTCSPALASARPAWGVP